VAIRCDELRSCVTVKIRDKTDEVLGKTQEVEYADQLAVVRRGIGTFESKTSEDDDLNVGVSVLHIEAKAGNRSRAKLVGTKSFMFRAEDLVSLDVIRSQDYDICGPKFTKSIG
jgi:hypothetical protein